jgi:uncharacterized protein
MIELSLDKSSSQLVIRSYQPGKILINDNTQTKELTQNLIISSHRLIVPWDCNDLDALLTVESTPEIILLGTGQHWQMIPTEKLMIFYEKKIGVEVMTTDSACRTFNILASEGRVVVAGLVI